MGRRANPNKPPKRKYCWKNDETKLAAVKNLTPFRSDDPKVSEEMAREAIERNKLRVKQVNGPILPAIAPRTMRELMNAARANTLSAMETVIDIMTDAEATDAMRLRAAEIILDRGWGKTIDLVKAKIDTDDDEGPAPVNEPEEEREGTPENKAQWSRDVLDVMKQIGQLPIEPHTEAVIVPE